MLEPGRLTSDRCRGLLDRLLTLLQDRMHGDLVSVARSARGRGRQDPVLAREFSRAISRLPHLVLVALDALLAQRALELAAAYRLRGSDAVYATVAIQFGSTLVTLDHEQRERVVKIVPARWPSEVIPS